MPTHTINDLKIHFEASGEGEPVVLVHGSWGDHHSWDQLVPELPDGFRAVRYDRRGHSASERPPGQGSVVEDVADLAALIDTVVAVPAHVVGNSLGAQIALLLAIDRPDLVRSLALHEPGFWSLAPHDTAVLSIQARMAPAIPLLEAGAWLDGARLFADQLFGPGAWDSALPERLKRVMVANAPTYLDEERNPDTYSLDPAPLADVTVPILLTTGDETDAAFVAVTQRLAAAMPHAEWVTLAGAGHIPHRTHPAEYAALLTSFWARPGLSAPWPGRSPYRTSSHRSLTLP